MKAKSIKGSTVEEIKLKLMESLKDGFKPTLALVFSGVTQDRTSICDILDKENISIFGSTSAGEFIDGELGWESISILLMEIKRTHFQIIYEETKKGHDRETAKKIGKSGLEKFSKPAFIICASNTASDGEQIIMGITDSCGSDITICGGMSGIQVGVWGPSYVFTKGKEIEYGIMALVIDEEKYELHGLASSGWKAVGTLKTITKSEGCWVYSIDNNPALDMLVKYMGIDDHDIKDKNYDPLPDIGSNFPMQIQRENGSFVMRTPMRANWEDKSFMCAGTVPEGSKIKFCLPADFEAIDEVISECEQVKNNNIPVADALIVFSCFARFVAFGPLLGQEIQGLKNIWDAPTAGFFTFGEFGRAKGANQEFHNITCSWVALKEK